MSVNAELLYPFADIVALGTGYETITPDAGVYDLAVFPIDLNSAFSIYAKVAMRTSDSEHFAQFAIANIFCNKAGVVSEGFQSDTITNRDNISNLFYFEIIGTDVHVRCSSGVALVANWFGLIGVIAI